VLKGQGRCAAGGFERRFQPGISNGGRDEVSDGGWGCGTRVSIESVEEGSLFIRGSGVAGGILTERGTLLWIKSDMKAGGERYSSWVKT
jgi:hypothetical protein